MWSLKSVDRLARSRSPVGGEVIVLSEQKEWGERSFLEEVVLKKQ